MTDAAPGPFASRDFRYYMGARVAGTLAFQIGSVATAWRVYDMTHRAVDLGYVGLVQFLPVAGLSLLAGHVADRFDRRGVIALCNALITVCWLAMAAIALTRGPVAAVYAVLGVLGIARAFSGPAGQALVPRLVPDRQIGRAVAWSSTLWQVAVIAGPALGGIAYGHGGARGAAVAFGTASALTAVAVVLVALMHVRTGVAGRKSPTWDTALAGVKYVWHQRLLLGAISLDLFAVLLGGAVALLPVYARDILGAGPWALGLLRSAPAVGAAATAAALAWRPLERRAGPWMLGCVALFGAGTIVFGVSRNIWLSFAALAVTGAADMVSVVVRQHAVQVATPDAMRGRVAAVNLVFIGASNELGEFESGVTAGWLGARRAVVLGGVGTLLVVLVWTALFPELRRLDHLRNKPDAPPT